MKIALVQMNIKWENKKANLETLADALEAVKSKGIALLLCPEMSFTGFSMNTSATAEACEYDSRKNDKDNMTSNENRGPKLAISSETVDIVKKLAGDYGISIGFGWVKALDGENKETACQNAEIICENHYTIVSKTGEVLSDYAKLHPFSYGGEDKFFKSGNELSFCHIEDFSVSTAICYDLRFPEIYQAMSKRADLIVQPANWPAKRANAWNTLLAARAIENQCYVAGINCVGNINGTEYSGDSAIYSPEGEKITPQDVVEMENATVFIYEIQNDVKKIREAFPVKNDRREELYARLYHI